MRGKSERIVVRFVSRNRIHLAIGALSAIFTLAGCGGPEDPTLPVSGMVTLNGTPLKRGDIEFGGKEHGGLRRGSMIEGGKYHTAPMQGLLPGEYLVRIFSSPAPRDEPLPDVMPGEEELGSLATRDQIPPEYNMRSKKTIKVTAEGPNVFDFKIETKK